MAVPIDEDSPARTKPLLSSHRLPTISASQALLDSCTPGIESTGLKVLDSLLASGDTSANGGGFQRGKVTELWGPSGAGKTCLLLMTAARTLLRGGSVVWVCTDTPLNRPRLQNMLERIPASDVTTQHGSTSPQDCLHRFHSFEAPSLSHLLALVFHPRPHFPPDGTSLLVIEGINVVIDLDYPRLPFINSGKADQLKWKAGRRYAVLGSLASALNKLAALNDLAVVVTTGCASRMRSETGLGSALAPGVGGMEWDSGIWNRLGIFRDFGRRLVGLQKCHGRSLISRDEVGGVGSVVGFEISKDGLVHEGDNEITADARIRAQVVGSPKKSRKRAYHEVADSADDDIDEYGWDGRDEDVFSAEGLVVERPDATNGE